MTAHVIISIRRRMLERWIEDAIALLDQIDGDPDCEPDADDEPEPLEPYLADAASDLEHDDARECRPGRIAAGR